jgi:hypothetical protein
MRKSIFVVIGAAACCVGVFAEELKLPLESDDKGTVYVNPKVSPTETSVNTKGATLGVERSDGSGVYGGVDTSTERSTYSIGGSTGGKRSYSAGAFSDGKSNAGIKAGVTIKY